MLEEIGEEVFDWIDFILDVNREDEKNHMKVSITDENDIKNYKSVLDTFPNMDKELTFSEEGLQLFLKITGDINKKNKFEELYEKGLKILQSKEDII